jgi:hypothetical protein
MNSTPAAIPVRWAQAKLSIMITLGNFVELFGESLFSQKFQTFIKANFEDLTEYNILDSDYIVSKQKGIELGFTNRSAVLDDDDQILLEKGNPIFSHLNIFPISSSFLTGLPFSIMFNDSRENVISKAGLPMTCHEGYLDFLSQEFLIDNYKSDNIIYSIDYKPKSKNINFIQARDIEISGIGV